jgi:hypothetical protein
LDDPACNNSHTFPAQSLTQHGRSIVVLFRQNLCAVRNHGYLATETLKTLGQFTADGAGADNNHSTRQFRERKDRLVRVITCVR